MARADRSASISTDGDSHVEEHGAPAAISRKGTRNRVQVVTGQETRIEAVRQWSSLLAEQISGWGSFTAGIIGIVDPHEAPALMAAHPAQFCVVGAGILSGRKLAVILKAALSIVV